MEKQKKISNKNASANGGKGHAQPLGTKPNDECYTSMQDILNEMSCWAGLNKFKGKNIICPCDWDIVEGEDIFSIHITYNDEGVNVEGNDVAKIEVEYDLWNEDNTTTHITLAEDEIDNFLKTKLTCNFVRTFTQKARACGIKSITASGYNPANGKGVPFQTVDYSKYDICCTNPPFSLYGEFMKAIVGKIDFICLAPFLNRVNPNVGLPLMLRQAYLGWGQFGHLSNTNMHLKFYNPSAKNNYNMKEVACDWITSFSEAQQDRDRKLAGYHSGVQYSLYADEYVEVDGLKMKDGTYPIRVPSKMFPEDYSGWMFAAINILGEINFNEYEWYGTNFSGYYTKHPEDCPFEKGSKTSINGKNVFAGIVFRKKPQQKEGNTNES